MNLIIVESPTKARTLGRFLGKDYQIDSTMGHIRDLPEKKFGVDIKKDFAPEYVPVYKKREAVKKIKEDAKKASKIYLATDPDREGEAIAWHTTQVIKDKDADTQRIVFHEITPSAVKNALEAPRSIDMRLVEAQQARRVLDRLVGYKLSPLLWRKLRKGLSAGRVQSVAVRLIVEREREIEAFVPEEYWEIWSELEAKKGSFLAKLIKVNEKKAEIKNQKQADGVVSGLKKAGFKVDLVEKKEVAKSPAPPFTTSTLTQSAARAFFWSAKKTMSLAQRLYEEGLITYHRTDSTNLAKEAVLRARTFIKKEYGQDYLPQKPRFYKTKSRVAQEAHEAVRPTSAAVKGDDKKVAGLGRDSARLYQLVWRRFVACQMADALFDQTKILVKATEEKKKTDYLLQTVGQVRKFEGWQRLYARREEEAELPEVKKDEVLKLLRVDPQQKFTEPPARYNEAALVKALEKLGIGRPSTYAPIISTIQTRQYVEKIEGRFQPTLLGVAVNDFLLKHFPDIFDYQFTADMEGDLDKIANGKMEWVPVIREFWQPFSVKLEVVQEKAERVKVEVEKTGEVCPKCKKGEQVVRVGRFGKFLSCSRFPECDWSAQFIQKVGISCPDCGKGEVIVRRTKRGKRFYGCSRYPDCRWASWRKPKTPS